MMDYYSQKAELPYTEAEAAALVRAIPGIGVDDTAGVEVAVMVGV